MRVLFTIPHFYKPLKEKSRHGSEMIGAREGRRRALDLVLFQLHSLFGRRQFAADHLLHQFNRAPSPVAFDFDIVICTSGKDHLLGELHSPGIFYTHQPTSGDPQFLGFECHQVLKERLGQYDYYCYLEDDIVLYDPLFFVKLNVFNRVFAAAPQPHPLLQPQRYEVAIDAPPDVQAQLNRVYLDYSNDPSASHQPQPIEVEIFGQVFTLERTTHPHAGCFFLTRAQMQHLVTRPAFLDRSRVWVSPLDTAATLAISETFPVYKPALDSLSFFEVCHAHTAMAQQVRADASGVPQWWRSGEAL